MSDYTHADCTEFENELLAQSDDSWDGDVAQEVIVQAWVDHCVEQVMRLGGCLRRWCAWVDKEPCDHGYLLAPRPRPTKCPRCDSPDPARHPAMQFEGEIQVCPHPWHDAAGRPFEESSQPWRGVRAAASGEAT